jgi:hypothetical protein
MLGPAIQDHEEREVNDNTEWAIKQARDLHSVEAETQQSKIPMQHSVYELSLRRVVDAPLTLVTVIRRM